jgi:hypothetical protein
MALGLLKLPTNDPKRPFSYKQVPAEKALRYYQILHNLIEPTPEEAEKAMYIVDVKLPPSVQPDGYKRLESPYAGDRTKPRGGYASLDDPKAPGSHMLNQGIEQGMSQALPTGDR